MTTTLYYFSGTGNSLRIANYLAETIEDCKTIPIAKIWEEDNIVCESENVGFVFPIYFFGLPSIVFDFLEKINLDKSNYVFAVATRGGPLRGTIPHTFKKLLRRKSKNLNAIFFITMVANNITVYNITSEEKQKKKAEKAKKKTNEIVEIIIKKQKKTTRVLTYLISTWINKKFREKVNNSDSKFSITEEKCNSCGVCENICPVNNITLVDGKPQWQHKCQKCIACIHLCPQKAIQYGKKTEKRRRYHHPEISVKDLINQK